MEFLPIYLAIVGVLVLLFWLGTRPKKPIPAPAVEPKRRPNVMPGMVITNGDRTEFRPAAGFSRITRAGETQRPASPRASARHAPTASRRTSDSDDDVAPFVLPPSYYDPPAPTYSSPPAPAPAYESPRHSSSNWDSSCHRDHSPSYSSDSGSSYSSSDSCSSDSGSSSSD